MAYDLKTDYQALMNAAQAKGDTAAYNAAAQARQEKIAAASSQQLNDWGVNPSDAAKAGYNVAMAQQAQEQAKMFANMEGLKEAKKREARSKFANVRDMALSNINTQLNNTTSIFNKSKNTALSNLDTQKSKISPTYYNMRNSASAQNQLQAKNLAEYLAARGQTKSNLAVQTEMNRQNGLNQQLNTLNSQEAQNLADIESKKTETANNYEDSLSTAQANANLARQQAESSYVNDIAAAENGIESNYLTNVMNQNQQNLQNARTDALNQLNRQDNLIQQDFQNNFTTSQFEYQKQKDANDAQFKQAQADIQNKLNERQITNSEAQQAFENAYRIKAYNDSRIDATWDKQFKQQTLNNQITQADLDRAYKGSQNSGTPTVKDYYNDLYQMQNKYVSDGQGGQTRAYNDKDIIDRVMSLPIDDTYKAYLLNSLGIQKPADTILTESHDPNYTQGGYTKYLGGR